MELLVVVLVNIVHINIITDIHLFSLYLFLRNKKIDRIGAYLFHPNESSCLSDYYEAINKRKCGDINRTDCQNSQRPLTRTTNEQDRAYWSDFNEIPSYQSQLMFIECLSFPR